MKPEEDWRARIPAESPRRKEVRLWRFVRIWFGLLVDVARGGEEGRGGKGGSVRGCYVGRIRGQAG